MSGREGELRYSIVIPAFDSADTVGPTIDSALAQTRADLEVIVVDDGSSDATPDVVASRVADPRLRSIRTPNRGVSSARNTGISEARGELVAFLDADDLLMPRYLEEMSGVLDATGAGFAFTDPWVWDDEKRMVRRRTAMAPYRPAGELSATPEGFLEQLVEGNFIFISTMVRRDVLERVGGFREHIWGAEDYDLWLRILVGGFSAAEAPPRLAVKRDSLTSVSKRLALMLDCQMTVWSDLADSDVPEGVRARALEKAEEARRASRTYTEPSRRIEAARRARRTLASGVRATVPSRFWYPETPPEVAEAFPALSRPR